MIPPAQEAEIVAHHLRLFGIINASAHARADAEAPVIGGPGAADVERVVKASAAGKVIVAVAPDGFFCTALGVRRFEPPTHHVSVLEAVHGRVQAWGRLRTLYPYAVFEGGPNAPALEPLVLDGNGNAVWAWLPHGHGGIIFVGTRLAADLVRYRQGDPVAVTQDRNREGWGFSFERPMYLFESQLVGEAPHERHADWWCWTLRDALVRVGILAYPIFPGSAPGVVVVTGDDDQAYLETYEAQLAVLGDMPITYFLHPLTKHDPVSMARIFADRRVDLGLHPDALDEPERYATLLSEQASWFERLTGRRAVSVRNHGFLNAGYWGHADPWVTEGIRISSNLPGLDGRVLNGSLMPARLALHGGLLDHWSVLTAIGDGIVFINGLVGREAGDVIRKLGRRVKESGVPGVIVLNLHPQNIEHTQEMHLAARELCHEGFLAWTMSDLLVWCEARDVAELNSAAVSAIG